MNTQVAVIGSFVQDLAFKVEQFPIPGETRIGRFAAGPGGKGSNQAVACHRQGISTVFIGAVGRDLFGDGYKEWVRTERLDTRLLTVDGAATGAASIVVNAQAENQIVVALGANDDLTTAHVLKSLEKLPDIKIVLLQAESNLDAAKAALAYAKEKNIFSIFNPAPINAGVTSDLIKQADLITPNETEFSFLLEHLADVKCCDDFSRMTDDEISGLCRQLPVSAVLITLGAAGSLYCQTGRPHAAVAQSVSPGQCLRVPAAAVRPVDTTGAGDAFNGGLAAGLVKFPGRLKHAIEFATAVAGLSTERHGTAPAMPMLSEVEQRFPIKE